MNDNDQRVSVDVTERVTPNEAARLCAHHLMLAAAYFEASPDDRGLAINQHLRNIGTEGGLQAGSVWVDYIWGYYEAMEEALDD